MIPVEHGVPAVGLVPRARLWRNHSGRGWCGGYGQGWLLHLWHRGERGWCLMLGQAGGKAEEVCRLDSRERAGEKYLLGQWGLEQVVIKKNPPQLRRGDVTVYSCVAA